jgi:CDP-glycerol glycerophosphotransferase
MKNIYRKVIYIFMYLSSNIIGINKKKIIFRSFGGRSYSDNPKAISEALFDNDKTFEIVWVFLKPKEKIKIVPNYIKIIKYKSLKYFYHLATAGFWVDNFNLPNYIYKHQNQIYIHTWHGDKAFKKILYDSLFFNNKSWFFEEKFTDLFITGSTYGVKQARSGFRYSGKVLNTGTPRNDKLVRVDLSKKQEIKNNLNISKNNNLILFAPTYRRHQSKYIVTFDIDRILLLLKNFKNNEWIFLARAHSATNNGIIFKRETSKVIDVSSYEDMNDLLLISDVLITDYSSSAGDFALTGNPIILYQCDRQDYQNEDRAFYFDIHKSPFWVAETERDLFEVIEDLPNRSSKINCNDILNFYGSIETGRASKNVINYILNKKQHE